MLAFTLVAVYQPGARYVSGRWYMGIKQLYSDQIQQSKTVFIGRNSAASSYSRHDEFVDLKEYRRVVCLTLKEVNSAVAAAQPRTTFILVNSCTSPGVSISADANRLAPFIRIFLRYILHVPGRVSDAIRDALYAYRVAVQTVIINAWLHRIVLGYIFNSTTRTSRTTCCTAGPLVDCQLVRVVEFGSRSLQIRSLEASLFAALTTSALNRDVSSRQLDLWKPTTVRRRSVVESALLS